MTTAIAAASAAYLYAIADAAPRRHCLVPGVGGAEVYALRQGPLVAWISDITAARIRPERRNLGVHQGVVRHLMDQCTVLPVAFGTVASDRRAVERLLDRHAALLVEQLQRVRHKVEMSLRVSWDVPDIFAYFVSRHAELAQQRDRIRLASHDPGLQARIELGRSFERLLARERELATHRVVQVLGDCCDEIEAQPLRREQEVMHLACLIQRHAGPQFQARVVQAAAYFDDRHAFSFSGPWPPHHFVHLALGL